MPKYSRKYATEDLDGALAIAALQDAAENEGDPEAQKILSEGDYTKILSSLKNLRNIETLKSATTPSPVSAGNSAGTSPERKVNTDDPNAPWAERLIRNAFGISPDSWKGMEKMADYTYGQGGLQNYLNQHPDSVGNRLHSAALAAGEVFMPGPGKLRYALPLLYGAYNYANPSTTTGGRAAQATGLGANVVQQLIGPKLPGMGKLAAAGTNLAYNALTGATQAGVKGVLDNTDINPLMSTATATAGSIPGAVIGALTHGKVGNNIKELTTYQRTPDANWGLTKAAAANEFKRLQSEHGKKVAQIIADTPLGLKPKNLPKFSPPKAIARLAKDDSPYEYLSELMENVGLTGDPKSKNSDIEGAKKELIDFATEMKRLPGGAEQLRRATLELLRSKFLSVDADAGPQMSPRLSALLAGKYKGQLLDSLLGKEGTKILQGTAQGLDTRIPLDPEIEGGASSNSFWVKHVLNYLPLPNRELRKSIVNPESNPIMGPFYMNHLANPLHGATGRIAATEVTKRLTQEKEKK